MSFPEDYKPMAFCRSCGRDFAGDTYFDMHRIGTFDPDERRCASEEEMHKMGLMQLTDKEMESGRHKHRLGYDVPMWGNPELAARLATSMQAGRAAPTSEPMSGATLNLSELGELQP